MSSTTLKKPQIKRDLAERSVLGVFESWRSNVIFSRNKLRVEFAGIASVEPNATPTDFKYAPKYNEGEVETGDVYLYVLSPATATASILSLRYHYPIDTARKLTRYFQRPKTAPALVASNLQEEI